jgi:DNA-binding response OmpR family regulator
MSIEPIRMGSRMRPLLDKDIASQVGILVVDDEPDLRLALGVALGRAGYKVRTVADAEAALDALREERAQVLITDVILPGCNGADLIKEVRSLYPSTRIIAMSGGGGFGLTSYKPEAITTVSYLAVCRNAGAHAVLAKPFKVVDIVAAIRQVHSATAPIQTSDP